MVQLNCPKGTLVGYKYIHMICFIVEERPNSVFDMTSLTFSLLSTTTPNAPVTGEQCPPWVEQELANGTRSLGAHFDKAN